MSAQELGNWMTFCEAEPIGQQRADINNALLCMVVANSSGNYKRVKRLSEFLPFSKAHSAELAAAKKSDVAASFHAAFSKATQRLKVISITAKRPDNGIPWQARS